MRRSCSFDGRKSAAVDRCGGFKHKTPQDSKTPLVAFALQDARAKLAELLKAAKVRITTSQNRFRVSVSVFNDMNDVDRLLEALPKSPPA